MSSGSPKWQDYPRWHVYGIDERHSAWKVLLPISLHNPILAVGVKGTELASLARSWPLVHVHRSSEGDIEWATRQGESLGHEYRFEPVSNLGATKMKYGSIAVGGDVTGACGPAIALRMLEPGGCVAWIGGPRNVPSASGLSRQGYTNIRRYALLPPRTARIMVPLGDRRTTRVGLDLVAPNSWRNRMFVQLARLFADLGCQSLLGACQVILAQKPGYLSDGDYLLDWVGSHMGCRPADVAVYSGWERLTLQLFDANGQSLGIAKVSETVLGDRANEREGQVLRRLENVPELRDSVPRVIATDNWHGHTVQLQSTDSLGPRKYTTRLTPGHLNFLLALSHVDRCEMPLEQWPRWQEIWRWAHESDFSCGSDADAIRASVETCAEVFANRQIPFHRVHGDFTPWNILLASTGLVVVDWEETEAVGLPMADLIHFAVERLTSVKNRRISAREVLLSSRSYLRVQGGLEILQRSLSLPAESVTLAAIYELWFRDYWWRDPHLRLGQNDFTSD